MIAALAAAILVSACGGAGGSSGGGASAGSRSGVTMTRNAALGAKYGVPGPRACTTATPPGDRLTAQAANAYVTCGLEGEAYTGDGVNLAADVSIQLSQPRAYAYETDRFDGVDPTKPVYGVRGSATLYRCVAPGAGVTESAAWAGKHCMVGPDPNGKGVCYKTTFGQWQCTLLGAHDMTTDTPTEPPAA
jgi:hypothetical protein